MSKQRVANHIKDNSSQELPVLREVDNTTSQTRLGDELRVAVIEGSAMSLPEYFQTAEYALNLLVRGRITATINHQRYELEAPCFSSILINQPIQAVETSDDHRQYVLGFSPHFGEDLHLNLSGEAHIRAYMRPVFPLVKQVTGRSAGECIAYNLIRQAKSLLLTTTLPVQQIADRLGFRNQSHFGTFFRREVGAGPKAFREGR